MGKWKLLGEWKAPLQSETSCWKAFVSYPEMLPASVRSRWGSPPRLRLDLCGLQKQTGHREWTVLWEWKPVNTALANKKKINSSTASCLTPLFRRLSSSLKLWFPGSCWSSSELLSLNFAQLWFCQISSLTSTLFHSFHTHFCPRVLLAHIWEEWPPNLPVGSQCTVGYFHRGIYQIS